MTENITEQKPEKSTLVKNPEATKISQQGNYFKILEELKEKNILETEIENVKKICHEKIHSTEFFTSKDYEILTLVYLFDTETFYHELATGLQIDEKLFKSLKIPGTDKSIILSEIIKSEGYDINEFRRGCYHHDTGKIEIPKFILNNNFTLEKWAQILIELPTPIKDKIISENIEQIPKRISNNPQELREYLIQNHINAKNFIPVEYILSDEEKQELINRGISSSLTHPQIMDKHSISSTEILNHYGFKNEAELANSHHISLKDSVDEPLEKQPASTSSLRISNTIASILKLADIEEALKTHRIYRAHELTFLEVLSSIINDAQNGHLDPFITKCWVSDELLKIDPDGLEIIRPSSKNLQNIEKFLAK